MALASRRSGTLIADCMASRGVAWSTDRPMAILYRRNAKPLIFPKTTSIARRLQRFDGLVCTHDGADTAATFSETKRQRG